ncbi:MAG TPA: 50S ribosomal protein L4 [Candidatus Saccharimonadales bacterium]|nr:50S ribosomal protein L4 [Candidatus Saccharimonadales bacterium]
MSVTTYTKTGNRATEAAKLDKHIFGVEVANHELIKQAYVAYLANGRQNLAVTKTRGLVRGGGRKPWRQKGTGRARVGSSRTPLWRGGGSIFGPTGLENYSHKLTPAVRQQALRQALTLANDAGKIKVIETFECKDGKVATTVKLMQKLDADKNVLLVIGNKDDLAQRATRNVTNLKTVQAMYVNVYDVMNADHIIISQKSLGIINNWLGDEAKKPAKKVAKE